LDVDLKNSQITFISNTISLILTNWLWNHGHTNWYKFNSPPVYDTLIGEDGLIVMSGTEWM
jgi:hypothetical protein